MSDIKAKSILFSVKAGAIGLGIFAVIASAAISVTYILGNDAITANKAEAKAKALSEVMPLSLYDQSLLSEAIVLSNPKALNLEVGSLAYAALKGGQRQGVILPVIAKDGYSGDISLLVGIDKQGLIQGVRTIEHKETPGLGDKVDRKKSAWIDSFIGRSLANTTKDDWAVKKDGGVFDGFTGATITPRAVVNAVRSSLVYHQLNSADLYNQKAGQ